MKNVIEILGALEPLNLVNALADMSRPEQCDLLKYIRQNGHDMQSKRIRYVILKLRGMSDYFIKQTELDYEFILKSGEYGSGAFGLVAESLHGPPAWARR